MRRDEGLLTKTGWAHYRTGAVKALGPSLLPRPEGTEKGCAYEPLLLCVLPFYSPSRDPTKGRLLSGRSIAWYVVQAAQKVTATGIEPVICP
jgi:hypothetical protein